MLHKAAYRLRAAKRCARQLSFSIRYTNHTRWGESIKMAACQDTHSLNDAFQMLWKMRAPGVPMKVSVNLYDFVREAERSFSFFDNPKKENASKVMDALNTKYKKQVLYLADIQETKDLVKNKIAFSSIPKYDID